MEILNNLWIAFNTQNEELIKIITLPLFFVEVFVTMHLFITISNIQTSIFQKFFYVLLASCSSLITNLFM